MRFFYGIVLMGLLSVLAACPPSGKSDLKLIQANNMDLPNLKYVGYESIDFALSDLFDVVYSKDYAISGDDAMCRVIRALDVYFSVEVFDTVDVANFGEDINQYSSNPLDIIQDFYVRKRVNSLHEPRVSIKKELPKSVKFEGCIQAVKGKNYDYEYQEQTNYFTATLKIEDEFYVFQLIGKADSMSYLYDDFVDLLSSVR